MPATTFIVLAVLFLSVGYFFGYHVRGTVQIEQPRNEPERQKKSYELKAERYFGSGVKL